MASPYKNTLKDKDFYSNNDKSSLNERPRSPHSDGKAVTYYDFPKLKSLIKEYPDLDKKLQLALKGRNFLVLDRYSNTTLVSFENDAVKFLEENNLNVIHHDSSQQSWLKTAVQKWKNLIDNFHKSFFCAIFNEEDFSKTYVCTTTESSELILSLISEFLDERPRDIKISPHFREFMRHNKKFSHLKTEETVQDGIWIRNIRKPLLLALNEEIRNVICQSYLLDENQYKLLFEMKNKILSNTENKFQVKSNVFSASIPLVVEVNPLTNVSCILREESGNLPVDSLIILDHQKPSKDFILDCDRYHYKIWQRAPSDIPANQVVYAEISSELAELKLSMILEDCLRKIYCSPFPVAVLGILPCSQIIQDWQTFVDCLTSIVEHLREEQVKIPHHYIMLIAENNEILEKLKRVFLNKTLFEKEVEKSHELILIEGDLTDQKVDVIVNSTNRGMDLRQGAISNVLLKKAGPDIERECERKYPNGLEYLQLSLTKGYGLPCNYVIHGVLPSVYQKSVISKFVSDCLAKSADCKFSSIAFPALGTGNLKYPPVEVAKEMKESFETFSKTRPNHGLEVRIVLFPGQPDINESFSKVMLNSFEHIPSNLSSNSEEKSLKTYQRKMLHWILFVNYSNEPKNMELVLKNFQKELKKVPFIIDSVDLEQLLFFTNIFELVPDIIAQYSEEKKEVRLLVPTENLRKLKDLLKDTKKTLFTDELKIKVKLTNKQVDILLQKVRQQYPDMKCQFFDNGQIFRFHSFVGEINEQAKNMLKSLLSLIEIDTINENQFSVDRREPEKSITNSEKSIASVYVEQEKVESPVSNSKKNEDIDCFQIADDFFIKVYQGDILNLNVDGIVNILGNENAKSIFYAAGDAVYTEYIAKVNGNTLINKCVLTSAGNLKQYKNIIHILGQTNQYSSIQVAETVYYSLMTAHQLGLCSVALPVIISDINGVLIDVCKEGYFMGVQKYFKTREPNCQLKEVHIADLSSVICTSIKDYFSKQFNGASTEIKRNYIHQSKENSKNISNQEKSDNMEVDSIDEQL